jgi:hypothetical protein
MRDSRLPQRVRYIACTSTTGPTISDLVSITAGPFTLGARFESAAAPLTCAAVARLLPLTGTLLQARWSGEAAWVPLGNLATGLPAENATARPVPGQILFYPGGISETEVLVPYGQTHFGSKAGELRGNHFLTVVSGTQHLVELGRLVQWQGAQEFAIWR